MNVIAGFFTPLTMLALGCLVLAVVFFRRPVELVCASFVVWGAIPYAAADDLTRLPVGPHPASILVLMTFVVQIVAAPRALGLALVRRFPFFVAVLVLFVAGVITTLIGTKIGGIVKLNDQVLAPLLAFWIVSAAALTRPGVVRLVRNTIIGVALGESVLALVQYTLGNVLFWESSYATRYWFRTGYDRWMGATDHPLVLALFLSATIPLLRFMRGWPQLASLLLMASALVVTQSRTGIIAGSVATIYVILASRASGGRKALTVGALAIGGTALASSSLATGLQDRIANDAGSAAARTTALDYFSRHWTDSFFAGSGVDSSYRISNAAGLRSSFENAFVIYAVDIGVIFSLAYLIALAGTAFLAAPRDRTGAWASAVIVLVICFTFSSLGVDTITGPLLYLLLAVAANSALDPTLSRPASTAQQRAPQQPVLAAA